MSMAPQYDNLTPPILANYPETMIEFDPLPTG
jgi:hypothetical protein